MLQITAALAEKAIRKSAKGHSSKRQVREWIANLPERSAWLCSIVNDGSYIRHIKYRRTSIISSGKRRKIDSPDLTTMCLQIIWLMLIDEWYKQRDPNVAMNCKVRHGITSKDNRYSVIHKMKSVMYDKRNYKYAVVMDQRKCYEHVRISKWRSEMRNIKLPNDWIKFGSDVCFLNGTLPIGTPSSPMAHHLFMLRFDIRFKRIFPYFIRYADDIFIPCETKDEACSVKWRVQNYWWYVYGMRAKRGTSRVIPLRCKLDFCGYVFHRNKRPDKGSHNKGFTFVRKSILSSARNCSENNFPSYFGILIHADARSEIKKLCEYMKLSDITEKVKVKRDNMDAPHVEIKDLEGKIINVYDYVIRKDKNGQPNWIKVLIGIKEGDSEAAKEFHGNFQGIINFICLCEQKFNRNFMPIIDAKIVNQCGYIFEGSTYQVSTIDEWINKNSKDDRFN